MLALVGVLMTWEGLTPPYATIVADPPWHYDKVNPDNPWMNVRPEARRGYSGGGLGYSSLTLDACALCRSNRGHRP